MELMNEKGVTRTKELDALRNERIYEFENKQSKVAKKINKKNIITILELIVSFVTACGSILVISYPFMPYISAISTLLAAITTIATVKDQNRLFELEAKIQNLTNNIRYSSVCSKEDFEEEKEKEKTDDPKINGYASGKKLADDEAISKLMQELMGENKEIEKPYQYIKR